MERTEYDGTLYHPDAAGAPGERHPSAGGAAQAPDLIRQNAHKGPGTLQLE